MRKNQFLAICSWQKKTFGDATALSKLHHLHQEMVELHTEIKHATNTNDEAIKKEFADCFILLFGAANSYGLSYEDICSAIEHKMSINYKRVWGKPDANGVVNHIK